MESQTFKSVHEILKCDHSNESYWAVLSRGTVYYAVQGSSNFFESGDDIQKGDHSNKSSVAVLFWALFTILCKVVVTCESVTEILKCDHSNESYREAIS